MTQHAKEIMDTTTTLASPDAASLQAIRSAAPIGAQIVGADLTRPIDAATAQRIQDLLHEHGVIVFRGRILSEEDQIRVTRAIGTPIVSKAVKQYHSKHHPELFLLSNIVEEGRHIGIPDAGHIWHSDGPFQKEPHRASLLHAIEVPTRADGVVLGDTLFASTAAAYDALDEPMKARLAGLKVAHGYMNNPNNRTVAEGGTRVALDKDQQRFLAEPAVHPLVRTHPFNGRKCLFTSEAYAQSVVGMDEADSRALLRFLFDHITSDRFVYRHHWQAGDLLIWDNTLTQHRAIADYALPMRRRMHRTAVAGSVPY
jgi:taurine dioxygenase